MLVKCDEVDYAQFEKLAWGGHGTFLMELHFGDGTVLSEDCPVDELDPMTYITMRIALQDPRVHLFVTKVKIKNVSQYT